MYGKINAIAQLVKSMRDKHSEAPSIHIGKNYKWDVNLRLDELDTIDKDIHVQLDELESISKQQRLFASSGEIDEALELQYTISEIKKKLTNLKTKKYQVLTKCRDYQAMSVDLMGIIEELNELK